MVIMDARLTQHICFKTLKDKGHAQKTTSKDRAKEDGFRRPVFKIDGANIEDRGISPDRFVSPSPNVSKKSFLFLPKNDNRNRLTSTPNQELSSITPGLNQEADAAFDFSPLTSERTNHLKFFESDGHNMDDIKSVLFPTNLYPKSDNLDSVNDITYKRKRSPSSGKISPTSCPVAKTTICENIASSMDFTAVTKPVFPNFFSHSPTKRQSMNYGNSFHDSGFDSVSSSINVTTTSITDSQNFGKDLSLPISPLKRRANDENDSCAISVESPMKRLAFMSLESLSNKADRGINFSVKSTSGSILNEPGSSFLKSPSSKTLNFTDMSPPILSNAIDLLSVEKKNSDSLPIRNELDDFIFTKPTLVLRRPKKKVHATNSQGFNNGKTDVGPIVNSKIGEEHFDIVKELADRNMQHIIAKIFTHIRRKDVLRCSHVSQSWSTMCKNNSFLRKQIKSLKSQYQQEEFTRGSENITAKKAEQNALLKSPAKLGSKKNLTAGRHAFSNLQQRVRMSPKKPVLMPKTPSGKNYYVRAETKFEHTERVKRTLQFGESVMSCPKCHWTAKIYTDDQNKAQCYRAECRFRFCVGCKSDYHWPKPCKIRSPVSPTLEPTTKSLKAASKKSMVRLKKRLMM